MFSHTQIQFDFYESLFGRLVQTTHIEQKQLESKAGKINVDINMFFAQIKLRAWTCLYMCRRITRVGIDYQEKRIVPHGSWFFVLFDFLLPALTAELITNYPLLLFSTFLKAIFIGSRRQSRIIELNSTTILLWFCFENRQNHWVMC